MLYNLHVDKTKVDDCIPCSTAEYCCTDHLLITQRPAVIPDEPPKTKQQQVLTYTKCRTVCLSVHSEHLRKVLKQQLKTYLQYFYMAFTIIQI